MSATADEIDATHVVKHRYAGSRGELMVNLVLKKNENTGPQIILLGRYLSNCLFFFIFIGMFQIEKTVPPLPANANFDSTATENNENGKFIEISFLKKILYLFNLYRR